VEFSRLPEEFHIIGGAGEDEGVFEPATGDTATVAA
jgi:hypothetical protein